MVAKARIINLAPLNGLVDYFIIIAAWRRDFPVHSQNYVLGIKLIVFQIEKIINKDCHSISIHKTVYLVREIHCITID